MEDQKSCGYYPVALRLVGRQCLIVGGGRIAERKLNGLLEAGADRITLISPTATAGIQKLAMTDRIAWHKKKYAKDDLEGVWLVIAATADPSLNTAIAEEAERRGILSNHTNSFRQGSFITPSVIRRGDLLIAVTASGSSPALVKALRLELEERYGERYGDAVRRLGELRKLALVRLDDADLKKEVLRLAAADSLGNKGEYETVEYWLESLVQRIKGRS